MKTHEEKLGRRYEYDRRHRRGGYYRRSGSRVSEPGDHCNIWRELAERPESQGMDGSHLAWPHRALVSWARTLQGYYSTLGQIYEMALKSAK